MIQPISNWSEVKELSDKPVLPLNAYVCRVQHAGIETTDYGNKLAVYFDIEEGDHRHFYSEEYKSNPNAGKKWKGVLSQFLPKNDGTEKDQWSIRSLKGLATAFEHSNPGYVWNWDESSLTGKLIGILMRNEEWEWEGKRGWTVRPFRAMSVQKVRDGEYTLPPDKPLKNKSSSGGFNPMGAFPTFAATAEDDAGLPF